MSNKIPIGEVVDLKQGFAINKKTNHHMSDKPTELKLLRIGDMKTGSFSVFVKDTIPEKFIVNENDIIYTRTGQVGLVFRGLKGVIHNNCFSVEPKDEKVLNRDYLFYVLKSREFYEEANAIASGAAQPDLTHSSFKSIRINIPKIEEQKRIASLLMDYDLLIDNNYKQTRLLKEIARRIYKEWFVDFKFPGSNKSNNNEKLPDGWAYKEFKEFVNYVRGKSYSSKELTEDGIIMVNLKNINPYGGYRSLMEKRYSGNYKDTQTLLPGDIVMGVTDMTQDRRLVGYMAVIPNIGEKMTFSMDLIKINLKNVSKYYFYSAMTYGGMSKEISALANGVNVLHLKPDSMMKKEMLVPSGEVMEKYDSLFELLLQKEDALFKQCVLAKEAQDRLLTQHLKGKVEV